MWSIAAAVATALPGLAASLNVQIGLQAGWPQVPPAAHAIEFYRHLEPVDAAKILLYGDGASSNSTGTNILSMVERKLSAEQVQLFRLLHQIGFFAPAIESQRSVCREIRPDGCVGAFLIISDGTVKCGNIVATQSLSNELMISLPSDLLLREIYGVAQHVVICGDLSQIEHWSHLIWTHADKRVFFRHAGEADTPGSVIGHGAELRIKSSEYSALLEEDSRSADHEIETDADADTEVGDLLPSDDTRPLNKEEIRYKNPFSGCSSFRNLLRLYGDYFIISLTAV